MQTKLWLMLLLAVCLNACKGQAPERATVRPAGKKIVGGGCDGCELMYAGMPATMNAVDTSAGWTEPGAKLLVTGKVYQIDGKTPAKDVIIYYWQTDNTGRYTPKPGMNKTAERHGHIRGWVKTDASGNYSIYTIRPAPYPSRDMPAHIHTSIKEPAIDNEYYIDEFVFDDDPLLTGKKRKALEHRGGSGILRLVQASDLWVAEHNIVLGLHIPDYPQKSKNTLSSGLEIGEDSPSFMPFHAWGPDKGTRTCPVCKYGRYHGIVYFVGNNPDWTAIKKWLAFLEKESTRREKYLKAYFVYGNEQQYSAQKRQQELAAIGKELGIKNVALTYVPALTDTESEVELNQINPAVANTFVIYRNRNIVDKYTNLDATEQNFTMLSKVLDETTGNYFQFGEPKD